MAIAAKSKPKVLLLGRVSADDKVVKELHDLAEVHNIPPLQTPDEARDAIHKAVKDHGPFEAVSTLYSADPFPWKFGPDQLGPLAPHTKLYVNPGAGYDTVDVDWITSTGAYFANCPLEVGIRTADATLTLILVITRGLSTQFLAARAGHWRDPTVKPLNWRKLTLGIIGLGNIGKQVAESASALGFNIIYSNRRPSDVEYEFVSKEELYKRADVVLLLTPLTKETRHLVDEKAFEQMKDGVLFVNVSRGPVVNEQHLVDALESGKVARAALDVFEFEPEIHPKLKENKNVFLTPHVAAHTDDVLVAGADETLQNIIQFLKTGKPNTPVNNPKPSLTSKSLA